METKKNLGKFINNINKMNGEMEELPSSILNTSGNNRTDGKTISLPLATACDVPWPYFGRLFIAACRAEVECRTDVVSTYLTAKLP